MYQVSQVRNLRQVIYTGPQPIPALEAMAIAPASNTTDNGENTRFPNVGGDAGTAVAGTVQRMGSDEIYRIGSFGHTELTGTDKPTKFGLMEGSLWNGAISNGRQLFLKSINGISTNLLQ